MDEEDLAFAGIARQAELIRSGELSAPELVGTVLARIERLGPRLNCFTRVLAEQALMEAGAAQGRVRAGEVGPLLGVPVAVKDNTDVAGQVTSHGTGGVTAAASADSEPVRRLRAAGAVIVAKTTMPELAMWGHFTESETWGATRNPWSLGRSTGGSSGGSAAAVAAGLVPGALGSDGGASIRVPAAMCGIFGLKPQRGRISMMPDPRHWHGLTVFGGLARSVLDAAIFDDALIGPADGDLDRPPAPERSFAEAAGREPGRLRIAVSTKPGLPARVSDEARTAVERTAELLRSLGHELRERDPKWGQLLPIIPRILCGIDEDAARLDRPDLLERRTRTLARLGRLMRGRALRRSREREAAIAARLNEVFEDHDVLLTPVTAKPAPPVGHWQGRGALWTFDGMRPYVCYTGAWNYTGQPAASVPAGFDEQGLPLAVQLVGRPNEETTLVSLAAQLEAARPWTDTRPPLQ